MANDCDVQSADNLLWSVMSTYVYRFVGLETLPGRLTDFDLQQFFQLGNGDVEAIRQRFRSDRRVAGALQLLFLRACGAPWTALPCCRATCCGTWPKRCRHRH